MNTVNPPVFPIFSLTVCVLILVLFGVGFNQFVKWVNVRRLWPVSLSVVFGVVVTIFVPTMMFMNVELLFWQSSSLYALCFAASGVPMIWGNVQRQTTHKAKRLPRRVMQARDEISMDIELMIGKIVKKEAEVVDVVHTLHEIKGRLKNL